MFIRLTFCHTLGDQVKAIRIDRIQEVTKHEEPYYSPCSIKIDGQLSDVRESFDEIFGIIQPSDELVKV